MSTEKNEFELYRVKVCRIQEELADVLVVGAGVLEQGQVVLIPVLLELTENRDREFRRLRMIEVVLVLGLPTRPLEAPVSGDVAQCRGQFGRLQQTVVQELKNVEDPGCAVADNLQ